jgi:MerR family copper efflux transcriptional regulator
MLVGELAREAGVTRKALRIYEAADILRPPRRTAGGYRVYDEDAARIVAFVRQAQRLGFRLDEIRQMVAIRRSGRAPCTHVQGLVREKLKDLETVRAGLRRLLRSWTQPANGTSLVCPHIEHAADVFGKTKSYGRKKHGRQENVAVPVVRRVSGSRNRG